VKRMAIGDWRLVRIANLQSPISRMKKRTKLKDIIWKISIIIVALSMVLGMVLPFFR
jgi:hypothetical protein